METKNIVAKNRKEFVELFKTYFIPWDFKARKENSEKRGLKEVEPWSFSDNPGFAMNKWTSFGCPDINDAGTFISVDLVEEEKK